MVVQPNQKQDYEVKHLDATEVKTESTTNSMLPFFLLAGIFLMNQQK